MNNCPMRLRPIPGLSRAGWHKALAIFFTLLPLSFVMDGSTFRFMFAAYPIAIAVMVCVAAVFWGRYYVSSKRSLTGR